LGGGGLALGLLDILPKNAATYLQKSDRGRPKTNIVFVSQALFNIRCSKGVCDNSSNSKLYHLFRRFAMNVESERKKLVKNVVKDGLFYLFQKKLPKCDCFSEAVSSEFAFDVDHSVSDLLVPASALLQQSTSTHSVLPPKYRLPYSALKSRGAKRTRDSHLKTVYNVGTKEELAFEVVNHAQELIESSSQSSQIQSTPISDPSIVLVSAVPFSAPIIPSTTSVTLSDTEWSATVKSTLGLSDSQFLLARKLFTYGSKHGLCMRNNATVRKQFQKYLPKISDLEIIVDGVTHEAAICDSVEECVRILFSERETIAFIKASNYSITIKYMFDKCTDEVTFVNDFYKSIVSMNLKIVYYEYFEESVDSSNTPDSCFPYALGFFEESYESYTPILTQFSAQCCNILSEGGLLIEFDGVERRVLIEFRLASDMASAYAAFGLKGASSNNPCIFCECPKEMLCDFSIKTNFPMRTLKVMNTCGEKLESLRPLLSKNKFKIESRKSIYRSQLYKPLLQIPGGTNLYILETCHLRNNIVHSLEADYKAATSKEVFDQYFEACRLLVLRRSVYSKQICGSASVYKWLDNPVILFAACKQSNPQLFDNFVQLVTKFYITYSFFYKGKPRRRLETEVQSMLRQIREWGIFYNKVVHKSTGSKKSYVHGFVRHTEKFYRDVEDPDLLSAEPQEHFNKIAKDIKHARVFKTQSKSNPAGSLPVQMLKRLIERNCPFTRSLFRQMNK